MKRYISAVLAVLIALPMLVSFAAAAPSLSPGAVIIFTGETYVLTGSYVNSCSSTPANIVSTTLASSNVEVYGLSVGTTTVEVQDTTGATATSAITVLPNNNFTVTASEGSTALPISNNSITLTRSATQRQIKLTVDALSSTKASTAVTFSRTVNGLVISDSDIGQKDMTSAKDVVITIPAGVTGNATVSMSYADGRGVIFSRTIYVSVETPVTYTSLSFVTPSSNTIAVGESITLSLKKEPSNANEEITFSSTNGSVLTVEAKTGKVTGVSPGTASVAAISESGVMTSISLTVIDAVVPTALWIDKSVNIIGINNQLQLSVSFSPSNASKSVKWSIINAYSPKYYIREDGLLITTSLAEDGDLIIVMCESKLTNISDVLVITVYAKAAAATLSLEQPPVSTIAVGAKLQLAATASPTDARLTWTSSNSNIISVSSTGLVTAVSAGTATITVASGALSATVSLRALSGGAVYKKVSSVGHLTVRNWPYNGAAVLGTLPSGTIVEFLGNVGAFSSIRYKNSTAYVSSQYLSGLNTMYVAASRLKVRLAPNDTGTELGELVFAQKVYIIDKVEEKWARIAYNGAVGYCALGYLNLKPYTAYPTSSTLTIRTVPLPSSTAVDRVNRQTLLTIEGQSGLYYYVSYSNGKYGYVARAYVKVVPFKY